MGGIPFFNWSSPSTWYIRCYVNKFAAQRGATFACHRCIIIFVSVDFQEVSGRVFTHELLEHLLPSCTRCVQGLSFSVSLWYMQLEPTCMHVSKPKANYRVYYFIELPNPLIPRPHELIQPFRTHV
jgi:hypothetical protein